eukprot:TRINITY_DN26377_c0_g1_i1.p2 TRINITY_DN26377_c0_g1~~TRINITY_DN26377_c0_g1_i1.p2  ORF type:complete len:132 (+),score=12.61 TRINITY_DN26377_c0_g1_i1:244-639(+)
MGVCLSAFGSGVAWMCQLRHTAIWRSTCCLADVVCRPTASSVSCGSTPDVDEAVLPHPPSPSLLCSEVFVCNVQGNPRGPEVARVVVSPPRSDPGSATICFVRQRLGDLCLVSACCVVGGIAGGIRATTSV